MDANQLKAAMADPAVFRQHLLIDTDRGPVRLADVLDDWQRTDFEALDPGWQRVARRKITSKGPVHLRAYLERGRGHSKTQDLAVMVAWVLFASKRLIRGVAAAADRDQARLLADAIGRLVALNPWLASVLEVQAWSVRNRHTRSELSIISSDAGSSFGLLVDFAVVDELTHWSNGEGELLWQSLISAAAKKATCLFCCISNAGLGMGSSWQWRARESFRENPDGYFSRIEGPRASWITQDRLAEQRRLLPLPAFDRLWGNIWSSGSSDLLADAEIQAAITLAGSSDREPHVKYLGGLDLGLSKNSAAFVIVGKLGQRCKLVRAWEWKPRPGLKVSMDEIVETIIEAHGRYSFTAIACDPWNAAMPIEICRKHYVPIRERPQSGKNLVEQAMAILAGFNTRSIDLFDCDSLLRDLRQARLEEKAYGVRIVSPEINGGHGDVLTAFTIALAIARGVQAYCGSWQPLPRDQPLGTVFTKSEAKNPYGEAPRNSWCSPGAYRNGNPSW